MTDESKPVGRPSAKELDAQALDDILLSPDKVRNLLVALRHYAIESEQIKAKQDILNDSTKALAKNTFGLSVGKFKSLSSTMFGSDVDEEIKSLTSTVDVIEILKENL